MYLPDIDPYSSCCVQVRSGTPTDLLLRLVSQAELLLGIIPQPIAPLNHNHPSNQELVLESGDPQDNVQFPICDTNQLSGGDDPRTHTAFFGSPGPTSTTTGTSTCELDTSLAEDALAVLMADFGLSASIQETPLAEPPSPVSDPSGDPQGKSPPALGSTPDLLAQFAEVYGISSASLDPPTNPPGPSGDIRIETPELSPRMKTMGPSGLFTGECGMTSPPGKTLEAGPPMPNPKRAAFRSPAGVTLEPVPVAIAPASETGPSGPPMEAPRSSTNGACSEAAFLSSLSKKSQSIQQAAPSPSVILDLEEFVKGLPKQFEGVAARKRTTPVFGYCGWDDSDFYDDYFNGSGRSIGGGSGNESGTGVFFPTPAS